jgi:putative ABC transport system permease protein
LGCPIVTRFDGAFSVFSDLRFAIRTLSRRRAFFAIAVVTLALGIGAATSIFSVVDGVLFRPLPFSEPGRLVSVWQTYPHWLKEPILASSWDKISFSVPEYRDWRAGQTSFDDVAIYTSGQQLLSNGTTSELVPTIQASSSLLSVLRVRPILGRDFLPGEDIPGGPAVALVSYDAWQSRYGGDSTVIGTIVPFETKAYEIVGVLPPKLSLRRTAAPPPQFWMPMQDSSDAASRGSHSYLGLARLRAGIPENQAALEVVRVVNASTPTRESGARVTPLQIEQTRDVRKPLLVLLAAVALLLLIACVNVATLLLGEGASREHEMATRVALGAARGRLVRQLLTESLTLAAIGASLGTALAFGGTRVLVALAPARIPGLADVRTDLRVLGVALAAAVLTGVVFGLAPALSLSRSGLASLMRLGAGQSVRGRGRLQRGFVSVQLALSVVLLVGGGLLSRSFARLTAVHPGFDPERLLTVRTALPRAIAANEAARIDYHAQSLARLAATPGVVAVTGATSVPFTNGNSSTTVEIEGPAGTEKGESREAQQRVATANYFPTLGIPLRAGRLFTEQDRQGAPLVAIVSESMARRDWPNASPLGKRIRYRGAWRTVVGIVGDVRFRSLSSDLEATVYAPFSQMPQGLTFLVRTRGDAASMAPVVRAALTDVNRAAPVTTIDTMDELIRRSFAEERYRTMLIGMFGVLAAVLAAVGMYGVTARAVSRRTREVGIRMALGASSRAVSRLIVTQTLAGVTLGVGVGIIGALTITRLLVPFLYGVSASDPWTYVAIVALLAIVSVAASWLPARRAGRVSPATVMRAE